MKQQAQGFTLIELMATLAILSLAVLIAIPSIGNLIASAGEQSEDTSIEMIESAAMIADTAGLAHDRVAQYDVVSLIDNGFLDIDTNDDLVSRGAFVKKAGATYEYFRDRDAGGVNLLSNTGGDYLQKHAYVKDVREVDGRMAQVINDPGHIMIFGLYDTVLEPGYTFEIGETYTMSYWAKASEPAEHSNSRVITYWSDRVVHDVEYTTEWQRYSIEFVADRATPTGNAIHLYPELRKPDGSFIDLYIADYQLEKGTLTDWSPIVDEDPILNEIEWDVVQTNDFSNGKVNGWSVVYGTHGVDETNTYVKTFNRSERASRLEHVSASLEPGVYRMSFNAAVPQKIVWRQFANATILSKSSSAIVNDFAEHWAVFRVNEPNDQVRVRAYLEHVPVGAQVKMNEYTIERMVE